MSQDKESTTGNRQGKPNTVSHAETLSKHDWISPVHGDISTPNLSVAARTPEEWVHVIDFMEAQNELEKYKEEQKTKRLWLTLSVASLLVALLIVTFAPAGRETLSYWIGGGLLVFAAGSAGYKRVWGRGPKVSIGADQDKRDL